MTTFLRTAFRVFKKDKAFTFINILGLTLGIMSAIIIFLVVKQEMSYDNFHTHLDRIYRINAKSKQKEGFNFLTATPGPMAAALKEQVPGVEESTLTYYRREGNFTLKVEGQQREFAEKEGVALVEPQFFSLFSFKVLGGDVNDLAEPGKVFLSESIARKFFGGSDPLSVIGATIRLDKETNLTVSGIVEDFPANTDFPFSVLISVNTFKDAIGLTSWDRIDNSLNTYFLLKPQADTLGFKAQIDSMVVRTTDSFFAKFFSFEIQPMTSLHFDSRYSNYNSRTISDTTLAGMTVLGAFLLLTACINFVNLATANAVKRSKEVGIRKVLGGSSTALVGQFLGETTFLVLISLALSIPLAYVAKPFIEELIGFSFEFGLLADATAIGFVILLLLVVVLLSGLYPSLMMSRFQPSQVIRSGLSGKSGSGSLLRKVLVVFQFLISQVLIIGLLVVYSQMDYFISKDLGFAKEGVVQVRFPRDKHDKGAAFKGEVANIPGVEQVSLANGSPTSRSRWIASYNFEGGDPEFPYTAELKYVDLDYIDMYGLHLLAGRGFLDDDSVTEVIVNRKMAEEMGFSTPEEAINQKVTQGKGNSFPIVGVVENFHTTSLRDPMRASFMGTDPKSFLEAGIKLNMARSKEALLAIEQVWNGLFPNEPFTYEFIDETIRRFYEAEQRLTKVIAVFTGIAIFIGCLGLYGLVSFITNQRQKEIGIRKVLGAGVLNIFYIISREFALLVVVAFALAAPLAFYYTTEWLNGFEYRVEVGPLVYILAMLLSLSIALISVSYKALNAAKVNPVYTLRTD